MTISISCPCTCGELFQGSLEGRRCLVSCPISVYSTATVEPTPFHKHLPEKAMKALNNLGMFPLHQISLRRRLPAGRGYGTSTADIGSALFAVSMHCGQIMDGFSVSKIAVSVEPTDSSLLPGLSLFDHRKGEFYEELGQAPTVTVVIIDPRGHVDSEAFNRQDWSHSLKIIAKVHQEAFNLLKEGVRKGNIGMLGEAATMSAVAHQSILFSPWLEKVLSLAKQTNAAGICRAHSGTILGILYDTGSFDRLSLLSYLSNQLPVKIGLRVAKMSSGGYRENRSLPLRKSGEK